MHDDDVDRIHDQWTVVVVPNDNNAARAKARGQSSDSRLRREAAVSDVQLSSLRAHTSRLSWLAAELVRPLVKVRADAAATTAAKAVAGEHEFCSGLASDAGVAAPLLKVSEEAPTDAAAQQAVSDEHAPPDSRSRISVAVAL